MKRNGFTMVELIFVIIIIGILSAAAIPKFGDIRDRAKASTEYSALSGLDSAIQAQMEMQKEDFDNIHVNWHNATWDANGLTDTYKKVNADKSVLGKILKKNENLKIVAYADAGDPGANGVYDDIFFIKGKASDPTLGVKEADEPGKLNGKPDKTDVWVFNASPEEATVITKEQNKTVESGEITLIDLTGKAPTTFVASSPDVDQIAVRYDANGTSKTDVTGL